MQPTKQHISGWELISMPQPWYSQQPIHSGLFGFVYGKIYRKSPWSTVNGKNGKNHGFPVDFPSKNQSNGPSRTNQFMAHTFAQARRNWVDEFQDFRDSGLGPGRIMLLWTALFRWCVLFYSLCFPISLVMICIYILYDMKLICIYIYIIYIRKHIHIHTFFYTPLFSHGGVSSQTYHGVPCPCKKIVRKFTPEPPGFGARSCVFNSYFQILFSEWWIIRID